LDVSRVEKPRLSGDIRLIPPDSFAALEIDF
jgi:hypothetical protein